MRCSRMKYALLFPCLALCQVSVPTYRYDQSRSGANLSETVLTPDVVKNHFGKLFTIPTTGLVFAQPLYMANLAIAGGTHNVLYVVTMEDIIYAFDADTGATLWSRNFTNPPAVIPVPVLDITNGNNITGDVGIESTPVIDVASHTIYFVARTKESGQYFQRLHALDITTGAERPNSPVIITATVSGTGTTAVNQKIAFDPKISNQRSGLALAANRVFIAWASHEDQGPYHGWVMAYDKTTLAQVAAVNITPNGAKGGIWQSGWAPAVDSTNHVYYASGNGDWDGVRNLSESVIKFGTSEKIAPVDYFTPDNYSFLTTEDEDLGASGPMLLPNTNFVTVGGKQGLLYLLNANNLGRFSAGDANALQVLPLNEGQLKGGPAYWARSTNPLLFIQAEGDFVKAFQLSGSTLSQVAIGSHQINLFAGAEVTVSANGSTNGVLWAASTINDFAGSHIVPGILRAYDASTLADLWNSEAVSTDSLGNWAKFVPPIVANGKVYAASFSDSIVVYGVNH
ncbi:MAG TPA: hypothetical protein VKR43_05970 [Bryobacteraceae bacterium]|nr:hypothetical protein [Bryobacteraceae bacterium]